MNLPLRSVLLATAGVFAAGALFVACSGNTPGDKPHGQDTVNRQSGPDTVGLPPFNGNKAYQSVAMQLSFGPRNPNSEGHKKCLDYIVSEVSKYTATVQQQSFTQAGYAGEQLALTNVIASFNPSATYRIMICAHWDTRPRGEQDEDSAKRKLPILGANDAGSGVGVLLELARILKDFPAKIGVDLVFLDGEDYGHEGDLDNYFLGSRYFSQHLPKGYAPAFGVLLDMIGDTHAHFAKEGYSLQNASDVVNTLWSAANTLGLSTFGQENGPTISDDHLPLNQAGLKTVDIIDGNLVGNNTNDPSRHYWHTSHDTMDNVSEQTMGQVGRLMVYMIYKLAPKAANAA